MAADKRIIVVAGIIAVIVAMAVVHMFPNRCNTLSRTEGFENTIQASCPYTERGAKSYYDKNGNLNCCWGQVNGGECEGYSFCTFSGNNKELPQCSETQRKRKYIGQINPWVKQYFSADFANKFQIVLSFLTHLNTNVQKLSADKMSDAGKNKVAELLKEETVFFNKNRESKEADLWQEEVMYVIQTVLNIFQSEPIKNDKTFVESNMKKAMCAVP